jgi:hypothetical protein
MKFIPLGDRNPLNEPDGQARVLNVILEQLCLLRAEVGAVQGTLLMAGNKLGIEAGELVKTRIELRDDLYQRIHGDILAAISGTSPSNLPPPS